MEPLIVLLISALLVKVSLFLFKKRSNWVFAIRVGLSAMFLFTGISHFVWSEGFSMMLPAWVPLRLLLVYLTGVLELVFAYGIFKLPKKAMGRSIILFLLLVLPANIYACYYEVNIVTCKNDGEHLVSLLYRIPIQILFIYLSYYSLIKYNGDSPYYRQ